MGSRCPELRSPADVCNFISQQSRGSGSFALLRVRSAAPRVACFLSCFGVGSARSEDTDRLDAEILAAEACPQAETVEYSRLVHYQIRNNPSLRLALKLATRCADRGELLVTDLPVGLSYAGYTCPSVRVFSCRIAFQVGPLQPAVLLCHALTRISLSNRCSNNSARNSRPSFGKHGEGGGPSSAAVAAAAGLCVPPSLALGPGREGDQNGAVLGEDAAGARGREGGPSVGQVPAPLLAVNGACCCVTVLQFPGRVVYQNPRSVAYFGDLAGQPLGAALLLALLQGEPQVCPATPAAAGASSLGHPPDRPAAGCSGGADPLSLANPLLQDMLATLESGFEYEVVVRVPESMVNLPYAAAAAALVGSLEGYAGSGVPTGGGAGGDCASLRSQPQWLEAAADAAERELLEALINGPAPMSASGSRRTVGGGGSGSTAASTPRPYSTASIARANPGSAGMASESAASQQPSTPPPPPVSVPPRATQPPRSPMAPPPCHPSSAPPPLPPPPPRAHGPKQARLCPQVVGLRGSALEGCASSGSVTSGGSASGEGGASQRTAMSRLQQGLAYGWAPSGPGMDLAPRQQSCTAGLGSSVGTGPSGLLMTGDLAASSNSAAARRPGGSSYHDGGCGGGVAYGGSSSQLALQMGLIEFPTTHGSDPNSSLLPEQLCSSGAGAGGGGGCTQLRAAREQRSELNGRTISAAQVAADGMSCGLAAATLQERHTHASEHVAWELTELAAPLQGTAFACGGSGALAAVSKPLPVRLPAPIVPRPPVSPAPIRAAGGSSRAGSMPSLACLVPLSPSSRDGSVLCTLQKLLEGARATTQQRRQAMLQRSSSQMSISLALPSRFSSPSVSIWDTAPCGGGGGASIATRRATTTIDIVPGSASGGFSCSAPSEASAAAFVSSSHASLSNDRGAGASRRLALLRQDRLAPRQSTLQSPELATPTALPEGSGKTVPPVPASTESQAQPPLFPWGSVPSGPGCGCGGSSPCGISDAHGGLFGAVTPAAVAAPTTDSASPSAAAVSTGGGAGPRDRASYQHPSPAIASAVSPNATAAVGAAAARSSALQAHRLLLSRLSNPRPQNRSECSSSEDAAADVSRAGVHAPSGSRNATLLPPPPAASEAAGPGSHQSPTGRLQQYGSSVQSHPLPGQTTCFSRPWPAYGRRSMGCARPPALGTIPDDERCVGGVSGGFMHASGGLDDSDGCGGCGGGVPTTGGGAAAATTAAAAGVDEARSLCPEEATLPSRAVLGAMLALASSSVEPFGSFQEPPPLSAEAAAVERNSRSGPLLRGLTVSSPELGDVFDAARLKPPQSENQGGRAERGAMMSFTGEGGYDVSGRGGGGRGEVGGAGRHDAGGGGIGLGGGRVWTDVFLDRTACDPVEPPFTAVAAATYGSATTNASVTLNLLAVQRRRMFGSSGDNSGGGGADDAVATAGLGVGAAEGGDDVGLAAAAQSLSLRKTFSFDESALLLCERSPEAVSCAADSGVKVDTAATAVAASAATTAMTAAVRSSGGGGGGGGRFIRSQRQPRLVLGSVTIDEEDEEELTHQEADGATGKGSQRRGEEAGAEAEAAAVAAAAAAAAVAGSVRSPAKEASLECRQQTSVGGAASTADGGSAHGDARDAHWEMDTMLSNMSGVCGGSHGPEITNTASSFMDVTCVFSSRCHSRCHQGAAAVCSEITSRTDPTSSAPSVEGATAESRRKLCSPGAASALRVSTAAAAATGSGSGSPGAAAFSSPPLPISKSVQYARVHPCGQEVGPPAIVDIGYGPVTETDSLYLEECPSANVDVGAPNSACNRIANSTSSTYVHHREEARRGSVDAGIGVRGGGSMAAAAAARVGGGRSFAALSTGPRGVPPARRPYGAASASGYTHFGGEPLAASGSGGGDAAVIYTSPYSTSTSPYLAATETGILGLGGGTPCSSGRSPRLHSARRRMAHTTDRLRLLVSSLSQIQQQQQHQQQNQHQQQQQRLLVTNPTDASMGMPRTGSSLGTRGVVSAVAGGRSATTSSFPGPCSSDLLPVGGSIMPEVAATAEAVVRSVAASVGGTGGGSAAATPTYTTAGAMSRAASHATALETAADHPLLQQLPAAAPPRRVWHKVHVVLSDTGGGDSDGQGGRQPLSPVAAAAAAGDGGGTCMTLTVTQIDVTEQVEAQARLAKLLEQEHKVLEGIFPRHVIEYMTLNQLQPGLRGTSKRGLASAGPGPSACRSGPGPGGAPGGGADLSDSLLTLRPGSISRMASLATWHPAVTILFADCVGFTSMCHAATPLAVMAFLNQLYSRFDSMIDIYKVYKVETIGDCYMVAGGLVAYDDDGYKSVISGQEDPLHAVRVMEFAKAMLRASREVRMPHTGEPVQMRIGMHSGPVTSGVVGDRMPRFCLFGDTVNTASRMESTCRPGSIHVSAATQSRLPNETWRDRGMTEVKGLGQMRTYEWAGDVDVAFDGGQLHRVIGLYL